MAQEQGPQGGVTPHLTIADGRAADAIAFYTAAFGADQQVRMMAEDGRRIMHAHLIVNGGSLMLNDDFPEYGHSAGQPGGAVMHLQVDDTDRWYARAIEAGATSVMAPEDMFWGDRYGQVADPFGYRWAIGSPIAR